MNYKPLADRVIVEQEAAETKTASGIVLPDAAQEKPQLGKVLAVGPGRYNDKGELTPLQTNVGDLVVFSKYGGTEIKENGSEYLIIKESDILAVKN
ncbi:MAG: co-chaperone GroES [Candidatus Marinamargulisbacteria bacterium]